MAKLIPEGVILSEMARRSHLTFMQQVWQRRTPLIVGQHTRTTCSEIDKAIKDYKRGISSFLAIKIPFRHGKSDIVSRYLPANFLGQFPDEEIIVAGYAYSLVRGFSRFCRNIIKDQRYRAIYPDTNLSKFGYAVDNWHIADRHGETHWIGIGGSATGKGGSLIVIDDFFKNRSEAESEVIRDKVWEGVAHDILTRRAPTCIVILLATPWHVDDVFGRIQRHREIDKDFPEFKEVKFPAFSEDYPGGTLFPERFSKSWYRSEKAILGPYGFASLMQCDPVARGGNVFQVDKIKYYDRAPSGIRWCRAWDLASSEKQRVAEDPDYTVGAKVGVRWIKLGDDQRVPEIYVDDIIIGRWAAPKRNDVIKSTAMADGPSVQVAIESFGPYKDAYTEISKVLKGVRVVKKMQLPGDKVTKACVLEAPVAAGNFHVRSGISAKDKLLQQFREFPGSAHDDIVDAVVCGFEGHDPYESKVWPQISDRHIINLDINWDRAQVDIMGTIHYVGVWIKPDMTTWTVMALWDAYKGYLFVYDAVRCDTSTPTRLMDQIINRARLKTHKCEAILCNDLAFEDTSKSVALQCRKVLKEKKVRAKVREAVWYNEIASVSEIGELFDRNMIYMDKGAEEMVLQARSWVTVDRGRQTGYRPDVESDGYCRALCMIVSELRRKQQWQKIVKPMLMDYAKERDVIDVNEKYKKELRNRVA